MTVESHCAHVKMSRLFQQKFEIAVGANHRASTRGSKTRVMYKKAYDEMQFECQSASAIRQIIHWGREGHLSNQKADEVKWLARLMSSTILKEAMMTGIVAALLLGTRHRDSVRWTCEGVKEIYSREYKAMRENREKDDQITRPTAENREKDDHTARRTAELKKVKENEDSLWEALKGEYD